MNDRPPVTDSRWTPFPLQQRLRDEERRHPAPLQTPIVFMAAAAFFTTEAAWARARLRCCVALQYVDRGPVLQTLRTGRRHGACFVLTARLCIHCSSMVGAGKVGVDGWTGRGRVMPMMQSTCSMVPCRGGLQARQWTCCCRLVCREGVGGQSWRGC